MCPHMHKAPLILAIRYMYKLKWKIQIFKERYYKCKKGVGTRSHPTTPLVTRHIEWNYSSPRLLTLDYIRRPNWPGSNEVTHVKPT